MGKAPADQFYWKDWIIDTGCLSLEAKGAWMDILCYMWFSKTKGKLSKTFIEYSRILGVTEEEAKRVILELIENNICDTENVTCNGNVTNCNTNVTLINRRMYREEQQRINTKVRVQKHRYNKSQKKESNGNVTPPSSSPSPSPTPNTKKKVSKEKEKPLTQKIKFLDEVFLTQKEHDRLIEDYGKRLIERKIEDADEWLSQGNRRKNYTDHNKMIRKWLRKDGIEKIQTSNKQKPIKIKCPGCKMELSQEEMNLYKDGYHCQWCGVLIKKV